jgi:hypothetical protein
MALKIEGPHVEGAKRVGAELVLTAIVSGGELAPQSEATWTRDGQPVDEVAELPRSANGETTLTLTIVKAQSFHAGAYQVAVTAADGTVAQSEPLQVELAATSPGGAREGADEPAADAGPPLIWDKEFARNAAIGLVAVFMLALIPMWWAIARILDDADPTIAQFVAFGLVIAGFMALGGAVFVALLELRGRARTVEELAGRRKEARALVTPEQVNELVKTFGSLKVPAALMVLSAAFFLGAFGLAWKEPAPTPAGSPAAVTEPVTNPDG